MNSFALPSVIGLMGRRPAGQRSMGLMGADDADEMFLRRYAQQGFEGQPGGPTERGMQDQAVLAQHPRERVSGWRLLDRVLGGETVTEGLDNERTRLQTQANSGASQERMRQVLGAIEDPLERAVFLSSPEDWAKNRAQTYAPQVISPGSIQAIGGRGVVGNTQQYEQGDERRSYNPLTGEDALVNRRGPTIRENIDSARIDADIALGQDKLSLDQQVAANNRSEALARLGIDQSRLGLDVAKADEERAAAARASANVAEAAANTASSMRTALTDARRFVNSAGVISAALPFNQNRANLEGRIDTLKGNLSLDRLMEMKANSPTGASGLGALSDSELRLLGSVVSSLSPDMSPSELEASFRQIDQYVSRIEQGAAQSGQVPTVTPEQARSLPPGTRFRTTDGREMVRR